MALEKPGKLRKFLLLLCGHPDVSLLQIEAIECANKKSVLSQGNRAMQQLFSV